MMNTENLKGKTRQTSDWRRRMIAFVSALTLLISSCGLTAFAEPDEDIYSDPVTAPIPAANTSPEPEEGEAEATPAPEDQPETGTEPQEATGEETETGGEPEVSEEPEDLTVYEPGALTAEADGIGITVDYTAEARVPEGAVLTLTRAAGGDLYSALKSASKVLKTEENATWKRELGEDAVFYAISLTNPEGNEVHPETGVTLTCTNLEIPADATGFVTGDNAENLDWKDTLTVGFLPDAIGYAYLKQVQIGTVTLTHEDRDYMVTAAYGPDAGFPADTELKVREILPGTPEYALYSGMTDEALNEDWAEITLERYFDIAFIANGEEMEPKADVDVQIVFRDKIEQNEETEVAAVHIENNEANVIEADTDSTKSARHDDEAIDTVTFTSDSFSVYGVVQKKKIITKVLAADGNTYEIEISYTQEAEIPEESQVKVEEIPEGSDLWEAYRQQTAAALGVADVRLPGLYDISIIADGQAVEPAVPVNVSIKLANAEGGEELHVVHFTEDLPAEAVTDAIELTDDEPPVAETLIDAEKITAVVNGDTVTFETDAFSVYAFAYTVDFHFGVDGELYDYSITGGGVIGLRELMKTLNILDGDEDRILEFVGEIKEVIFSDESLVKVLPVTEDITAAELKEKYDLVCSYSAELTEEEIAEMDAKELYAPDWAFVSLKAFNTDEKLTITLKDGEVLSIDVTDAQIVRYFIDSKGDTYEITVTYENDAEIPEDAELRVREILPGNEAYAEYMSAAKAAAGISPAADTEVTENGEEPADDGNAEYGRFFDIEIWTSGKDGEEARKIQPAVPVTVDISLADAPEEALQVVHFEENGPVVLTSEMTDDADIRFETDGFSVYAIVPAPSVDQVDWVKVTSLDNLISDDPENPIGFYIGHTSGYYLKNGITTKNSRTGITKTGKTNSPNIGDGAARYYFEKATDGSGKYYIYCMSGSSKKYVYNGGDNSLSLRLERNQDEKTAFTIEVNESGVFQIHNGEWYWNMQGGASGMGFCSYNSSGDVNNNLYIWGRSNSSTEPYGLDGLSYGLMTWAGGRTAKALLAAENNGANDKGVQYQGCLEAKFLSVMTHEDDSNSKLFVPNNTTDTVTTWKFEWQYDDIYQLKADNGKYLSISDTGLALLDTPDETCLIQIVPGTNGTQKNKICLKAVCAENRTLTYSGDYAQGYNLNGAAGNEWLYLVTPMAEDQLAQYEKVYTATKVSISNTESVKTGEKVVIYARQWKNDHYEYYAINSSGGLVPCSESGDSIIWYGGNLNDMLWQFTEYVDEGTDTPNGYYELENVYARSKGVHSYLAPKSSDGSILSGEPVGVLLQGRTDKQYYSSIVAWDSPQYMYSALTVDLNQANPVLEPCVRADGLDFYFAIMEDVPVNDELHEVPTVDHSQYGIVMKMKDLDNGKTSEMKGMNAFLGNTTSDGMTTIQTKNLLSTNLTNGYPTTRSGQSLKALYDGETTVNHLFIDGTYRATGYYVFDSTQNFASLQGNDFIVYRELGTNDTTSKPTLQHGEFFPYNKITAGRFASVNPENLYPARIVNNKQLSEDNPRKHEQLYLVEGNTDYYFAMELEASFIQTPNGLDAWGHDIIFEFSGDDDFWLYVDDELVLDLGGIHSAIGGNVNFRTGVVNENGTTTTLYELFQKHYIDRDKCTEAEAKARADEIFEEKDGNHVFKDNTPHTMRIFYMERGAGASNLHMKFNLAAVKKNTVQLSKELEGVDASETSNALFPYQIYYTMEGAESDEPEKMLRNAVNQDEVSEAYKNLYSPLETADYVFYKDSDKPVPFMPSVVVDGVTYYNVFLLKPGETADISFPVIKEDQSDTLRTDDQYRIVECGVDPTVYTEVKVNDVTIDGTENSDNPALKDYGIGMETAAKRPRVNYVNKVETLNHLTFVKELYRQNGESQDPVQIAAKDTDPAKEKFDFRLEFKTPYDAEFSEASLWIYHVKDPNGYYCKWDSNEEKFVPITYTKNYNELTKDTVRNDGTVEHGDQFWCSFETSPYGAISKIPAYYTVEIRDLIPGTKYRIIERPTDIPDGYKFWQYTYEDAEGITQTVPDDDPMKGIEGTIPTSGTAHATIRNYKGYGLRLEKAWEDAQSIEDRDPTCFAVYKVDAQGAPEELVTGSVQHLAFNAKPQELYWWYSDLPFADTNLTDYAVFEVKLKGDSITVENETVSGYTSVEPVIEGGILALNGTPKGQSSAKQIDYKVSYAEPERIGDNVLKFKATDTPTEQPPIRIVKEDWTGNPLPGADFSMRYGENLETSLFENEKKTSDENGLIAQVYLQEDMTYTLTELKSPTGYVGMKDPLKITLTTTISGWKLNVTPEIPDGYPAYYEISYENDIITLTVKNHPYELKMVKVDSTDTSVPVAGAIFSLYKQLTIGQTQSWDEQNPVYTNLTTGNDGVIPSINEKLLAGTYQLRETSAPDGYLLMNGNIDFTVSELGEITLGNKSNGVTLTYDEDVKLYTVTISNTPVKKIRIQKIGDDNPQKGLAGAKFSFKASTPIYGFNDYGDDQLVSMKKSGKVGFLPSDSNENTEFILPVLPSDQYYILTETTEPKDYLGLNDAVRLYVTTEEIFVKTESKLDERLVDLNEESDGVYILKVTNNRKGALSITKTVTVDGKEWSDTEKESPVDGIYTFTVSRAPDSSAAESTSDSSEEADPSESDKVIRYVQITVTNGKAVSYKVAKENSVEAWGKAASVSGETAIVGDLREGDYVIAEIEPTNGSTLVSASRGDGEASAVDSSTKAVTVHVTKGKTTSLKEDAQAFFTNDKSYIYIVKRWYNAYGEYEEDVTIPVTVQLHKVKDGNDTIVSVDSSQTITVTPGTVTAIEVNDVGEEYYVVETPTYEDEGYVTRYASDLKKNSRDESKQNDADRFVGIINGKDNQVSAGDTLYVMNTAKRRTTQYAFEKKWIEFNDPNGQTYEGQLDGANTTAERAKNMKLEIQLWYDAYDTNKEWVAGGKATDPFIIYDSLRTIDVANKMPGVSDVTLHMVNTLNGPSNGQWLWKLSEESGIGQSYSVVGNLPDTGYLNNEFVKYTYYFKELKIYEVRDWNDPSKDVDVTDDWWKRWVEENSYPGENLNPERTTIENRPNHKGTIKVQKKWVNGDYGAEAVLLKVYRTVGDSASGAVDITDELSTRSNLVIVTYDDSSYLKLSKNGEEWPAVEISGLPLQKLNDTEDNTLNLRYFIDEVYYIGADQEVYSIPAEWHESYGYDGHGYPTTQPYDGINRQLGHARRSDPATLTVTNTLPSNSISVTKQWKDAGGNNRYPVTDSEKTIRFKVYYNVAGEETGRLYATSASDTGIHTISFTPSVNDQGTVTGGVWSEFELTGLPIYVVDTVDGQKSVKKITGYYVVEETDTGVPFTVSYQIGNEAAVSVCIPVTSGLVTIINTDTTGKVIVTKTFTGIDALPEGFGITAAWDDGTEEGAQIKLTTKDSSSNIYNGITITKEETPKSENSNASYTWTIEGLPVGTEVTFTEYGYSADGYNWTSTVSVNGGEAESRLSGTAKVTAAGENVTFMNTYVAGVELPATGGSGTLIYTITGIFLITLAGALLVARKRKANR